MAGLNGKNVVVIGGSRGLGRVIVAAAQSEGARVLAVARRREPLAQLAAALPGVMTLATDAVDDSAPARVFETLRPDVLVMCGGASPYMAPLQDQTWDEFARTWDTDVRASFLFCREALRLPLSPGATVMLISSGAAIGGSPLSGSYAGAKRMQMFIANYCQQESDRLKLGLRFLALAPQRIMSATDLGKIAVEGYSKYLGIPASDFVTGMGSAQTPEDVAKALVAIATAPNTREGNVFMVSAKGIQSVPVESVP